LCRSTFSLTSALVGGEWSASRPYRFTPGESATGTHWIGGWVDPRAGLDDVEKIKFLTLPGLELRPLDRPARSQSLYRLRYPGSLENMKCSQTQRCVSVNKLVPFGPKLFLQGLQKSGETLRQSFTSSRFKQSTSRTGRVTA
jgi:hypothetical protein